MARGWAGIRRQRPLSLPGAVLAVGFLGMSLTPSLLPRTWLIQGLVSGLSAATGYGLGVLVGWVAGSLTRARLGPRLRRAAWRGLAVATAKSSSASFFPRSSSDSRRSRSCGSHGC